MNVMTPLYELPIVAPANIPNAYYGVASLPFAKTHVHAISVLNERLTIITNQTINLVVPDGTYGWFYIRGSIDNVRFMDIVVNMPGGWDGAGWPDNGSIGSTQGHVVVLDGTDTWHLFRTDFPAVGDRTFRVSFDAPESAPAPPPPAEPNAPLYGVGILADYNEATVLEALKANHTYTSGSIFSVTTNNNYAYYAVPVAYNPVFIDQSNMLTGGWDGASWDTEGNIGGGSGPVALTIAGQPWKIYRLDFAVSGTKNYRVNY